MAGHRWARSTGVPLVTSYCTNFPDYLSGYRLGWAEGWCWSHLRSFHGGARLTLCPSNATLEELRRRGFHERMRIWGRGVDSELFNPSRRSEALRQEMAPGAEVILVYVGRIAPEKKVGLLLEAFPKIRERASRKVALVYVGDGPALEGLRRRGVQGVHFTGYRRGEALAAHYASADAFVFPSDTETFGQVVTEALASGIPAVAPARGGVMDTVVPGETGWLFQPGDVDDLVERALHLVEHPEERRAMGLRARRAAEERSWEEIFRRLFADYAEAARLDPRPAAAAES
jgi:glycosyltransferase involved in cell wall biosynthesis